jgi:hypothetical protein
MGAAFAEVVGDGFESWIAERDDALLVAFTADEELPDVKEEVAGGERSRL